MRIRKRGKIRDRLWYLGHEESGIYLVESDDGSMIITDDGLEANLILRYEPKKN